MRDRKHRYLALALGATLLCAGCAPEPGDIAGMPEKGGAPENGEHSWSDPVDGFDPTEKQTELPETFPTELFPIPADATIDDTGERGPGAWYVVFSVPDRTAAEELWLEIIAAGGFTETDVADTPEGGHAATLTNAGLRVTALTVPETDAGVLVSYDLTMMTDQ